MGRVHHRDTTSQLRIRCGSSSQIDKKIIITMDDIDYSTSNVQHIKLKDFLLLDNLK